MSDRTPLSGASAPALNLAVFVGDHVAVHELPRDGSVTIGRAPDNDIIVDHPSVSRKHCVLHTELSGLRVEDLGGPNGTFVRDSRYPVEANETQDMRQLSGESFAVTVGDCINVGSALLVVRRAPERSLSERGTPDPTDEFVILNPAMRALYEQARLAASAVISVLILGETGVGKEVLAQEIHRASPRAKGPFVGLNCAALSESLLESELFGHEKGAFTGAAQTRPGLLEVADEGTVFLDEVGELPMPIQVKLLRVLEERQVLRVGGRVPRKVDVRFLSATNRDLEAQGERGSFRADLYFRLNGISLTIPPLRDRPEEIEPLARKFATRALRQLDRQGEIELSAEFLGALSRHPWPGNVRELRNVIERAAVLSVGTRLFVEHLPPRLVDAQARREAPPIPLVPKQPSPASADGMDRLRREMNALERQRIVDALDKCGGNQTRAATLLGISRRTLVTRIGEFGIPRPRKR